MSTRRYSPADLLLFNLDTGLRTLFGKPATTGRPDPAAQAREGELTESERRESVRLLRVDHCGEVCAQALYQGQALTARDPAVRTTMERAAAEENDHLAWCADRIHELGGRTSVLSPFFYLGSLALGAAAGIAGDRWSLGFLAETEHQVVEHLQGHLHRLPANDGKSRAIVAQMKQDEAEHATTALNAGGAALPAPIPQAMRLASKVMTGSTYWL